MARSPRPAPVEAPKPKDGDRRRTILRAAIDVFAKKGYHGCRIADVAREAGVAYGLVYHYFKNKEELLQSVFELGWTGFVGRLQEVATSSASLSDKVQGIARVSFEAYRHDPRGVKVILLEIARSPAGGELHRQATFSDIIRLTAGMFSEAQQKGELRPDADPNLCAALLFGAIEMGLTAFVLGVLDASDERAVDRAREQISDSLLHGFLTGTPAAERAEQARARPATLRD